MQTEENTNNKKHEYQGYFVLLDTMQGGMNMYGAPAMLRELFPELAKREAIDITTAWMKSKVGSDE